MGLKIGCDQEVTVFVAHVKKGYENRRIHIENHLKKLQIPFEYMLDGDIPDMTPDHLTCYFDGKMKHINAISSCALKHFYIYDAILLRNLRGALVLEDDIFLSENCVPIFQDTIHELENNFSSSDPMLISYENSSLKFIPSDEIQPGKYLYRREKGRCTGAYYINNAGASFILNDVATNKCHVPIDYLHNNLSAAGALKILWCHPAIAEQGSHNGIFASGIGHRKSGLSRRVKWLAQKFWKVSIRSAMGG